MKPSDATTRSDAFDLTHASISDLRTALDEGTLTCVELVALYLNRIGYYDRHGIRLNAVPILNRDLFEDAYASDQRRAAGTPLGPLDGIPYLAKDSYAAKGLTVASGSPAFETLVAQKDSFVIQQLRAAGAVLIGLTNMPPMAAGGMQRGLYGRAESPYNDAYLTAAFASGSSNGSGTGCAAGFAAFSLGEETWSSGRTPASNNGLSAYTPSRGLISTRGNWPLIATMDVVAPFARCMDDLLEILNVLVEEDEQKRGDLWRQQHAVKLPKPQEVRPADYRVLRNRNALAGKRIGVPRMYINKDGDATRPIDTRASIMALWVQAEADLKHLGAEVIEVDFPAVTHYERGLDDKNSLVGRGIIPAGYFASEAWDLVMHSWDDFLKWNGDPHLSNLAQVDGKLIFPVIPGALPDLYEGIPDFVRITEAAAGGVPQLEHIPCLAEGLRGLEQARKVDLEEWMDTLRVDAIVFPSVADVGPADADYNPTSQKAAWRNGVWVANGNQAIRHLGIPTVTTCMGIMEDIRMPVGLTFAGRAYDDNALLSYAYAFEQSRCRRAPPPRTPPLPEERVARGDLPNDRRDLATRWRLRWRAHVLPVTNEGCVPLEVQGESGASIQQILVFVNGEAVTVRRRGAHWVARTLLDNRIHYHLHSRWRAPYGSIVVVLEFDVSGAVNAEYQVVGGIG